MSDEEKFDMSPQKREFSHVYTYTGYMKKIVDWFAAKPSGMSVLDMPAGAGKMREALNPHGHKVVCGDINKEKEDYVYVDMNKALPFPDNHFDAVTCLEGIEHVLDPTFLIGEITRITKKGGTIIISVPNITNMYSRLMFLFTGIFFQFNPTANPRVEPDEMKDRGHISPMPYWQLKYLFDYFGATVSDIDGDRFKKKILLPIFLPIILLGKLFSMGMLLNNKHNKAEENAEIHSHMMSAPLLLSRSLILYLTKR